MALIEPGMPCSLCGKPIDNPDVDTFCTTAWAKLHCHPQFSLLNDAAVHQSCIDAWAQRDAFITFYNSEIEDRLFVDQHDHVIYRRRFSLADEWRRLMQHERRRKRNHVAEFFFVAAIVIFVWLFLFAGVYNAITRKPIGERTPAQQRIVKLMSILDDGDETLYFPADIRYVAALFGIPAMLASIGLFFLLRVRNQTGTKTQETADHRGR